MDTEIIYDTAIKEDISELIRLRIAYIIEDFGNLDSKESLAIQKQLADYFDRKLGKELIAFVARAKKSLYRSLSVNN